MTGKLYAHIRSNVVGYVALFCFAIGGTAYATHPGGVNTISSGDIINGQVAQPDLAADSVNSLRIVDGSVRTAEVADNNLTGADVADTSSLGGPEIDEASLFNDNSLDSADIASNAVGGEELVQTVFFDNGDNSLSDPVGGGSSETELINTAAGGYQILGRCTDAGGGVATAQVILKSTTGSLGVTLRADSDAPGGAADVTGVPPGTEVVLASHGPTDDPHWGSGAYSVDSVNTNTGSPVAALSGVVSVGTHVGGGFDCSFAVTGIG